jgi:hypothetical protein
VFSGIDRVEGLTPIDPRHVKNNSTGETIARGGPYLTDYKLGTVLEEACLDKNSCFLFSIYDAYGNGLNFPGQYAIFLDGEDVARGSLHDGFAMEYFGRNCLRCPMGTEPAFIVARSCDTIWVSVGVSEATTNSTIFEFGSDVELPVLSDYSCEVEEIYTLTQETCLDPQKCYHVDFPVYTYASLGVEFGGNRSFSRASGSMNISLSFGNLDQC